MKSAKNVACIPTQAIFAALSAPDCRLKRLNMSGVNLSSVDAGVMADAVNTLETADMRITHLTSRQGGNSMEFWHVTQFIKNSVIDGKIAKAEATTFPIELAPRSRRS